MAGRRAVAGLQRGQMGAWAAQPWSDGFRPRSAVRRRGHPPHACHATDLAFRAPGRRTVAARADRLSDPPRARGPIPRAGAQRQGRRARGRCIRRGARGRPASDSYRARRGLACGRHFAYGPAPPPPPRRRRAGRVDRQRTAARKAVHLRTARGACPEGACPRPQGSCCRASLRYFRSHGPAQVQDFVWWSGLTMADARAGIAGAGAALERQTIDGKDYWSGAGPVPSRKTTTIAHLLPNFDEYTVGYRDRSALTHADRRFEPGFFSFGSILSNIVIVDGLVRGEWRRTLARDGLRVEIRIPHRLQATESAAIGEAGRRLAAFLERPVILSRI